MQILSNLAADGASADFGYSGYTTRGHMNIYVAGSLGGGTLTLEAKLPDGTGYVPVQSFTAAGMFVVEAAPAVLRLSLSGSMTPSVSAWVESDSGHTRGSLEGR
jgi:hypothetical protein